MMDKFIKLVSVIFAALLAVGVLGFAGEQKVLASGLYMGAPKTGDETNIIIWIVIIVVAIAAIITALIFNKKRKKDQNDK